MKPDSTVGRGSLQALNRDRPQIVAAAFKEKVSEPVDEKRVDSGANSFTIFTQSLACTQTFVFLIIFVSFEVDRDEAAENRLVLLLAAI